MTPISIGNFDERLDAKPFCIGPYGRLEVGMDAGTITLIDCTAAAVMLIGDRHLTRLNIGSTLPFKGNQRYIVNPYSKEISGLYYEGLPVKIGARVSELDPTFTSHKAKLFYAEYDETEDVRSGLIFMAKRGNLHFSGTVDTSGTLGVSILPEAKEEYIDLLPAGLLEKSRPSYNFKGTEDENILARAGVFDADLLEDWVTDTEWGSAPRYISSSAYQVSGTLPEGSALMVHCNAGSSLIANFDLYDMGEWSREWTTP
jgi:hypothetical protein